MMNKNVNDQMNPITPNCVNSETVENMEIENLTNVEVSDVDELQNATGTEIVVEQRAEPWTWVSEAFAHCLSTYMT